MFSLQFCKSAKSTAAKEPQITYTEHIAPIMEKACTPCHFPDKGKKKMLDTYEATKTTINDILNRVQLEESDKKFMPFKSKKDPLTTAEINLMKKWLAQGLKE